MHPSILLGNILWNNLAFGCHYKIYVIFVALFPALCVMCTDTSSLNTRRLTRRNNQAILIHFKEITHNINPEYVFVSEERHHV
jgi:hypothetical protein